MTTRAIWAIGAGQLVNWGVLYYAFGVLLVPVEEALGVARWLVAGAFSIALLVSALAAPAVGRLADRGQGPAVMQAGGFVAASLLMLWAAVPTYISSAPSPKAALALVRKATDLLGVSVPTGELEVAARSYEDQVNEVVANDEETSDYVSQLEQSFDESQDVFDVGSGASLVEEVERFLRDQD